jgi:hypothetical protein
MFLGYESEAKMRAGNPLIADHLVSICTRTSMNVCTKPGCVGSIDGKTYRYDDGSEDSGIEVTKCRSTFLGNTFEWTV